MRKKASVSFSLTPADPIFLCTSAPSSALVLRGLAEGQKISYEIVVDNRSGKSSADQLQVAA